MCYFKFSGKTDTSKIWVFEYVFRRGANVAEMARNIMLRLSRRLSMNEPCLFGLNDSEIETSTWRTNRNTAHTGEYRAIGSGSGSESRTPEIIRAWFNVTLQTILTFWAKIAKIISKFLSLLNQKYYSSMFLFMFFYILQFITV